LYPGLLGTGAGSLALVTHEQAASAKGLALAFLAVPHTAAQQVAGTLLARGTTVIDLSADFRLKDAQAYERWYGVPHTAQELLATAVYGLPELCREELRSVAAGVAEGTPALIANPGCYPTATTLAALPALAAGLLEDAPLVANAISGVSGAGRAATSTTHFCSADSDLAAYGAATHRHTPEIEQALAQAAGRPVSVVFTPHLAPLKRGMVSTVVAPLAQGIGPAQVEEAYAERYADEPFVAMMPFGTMPHSAHVAGTNRALVGIAVDERAGRLVASCAIDNLGKGAASQAVQNANLALRLPEDAGLVSLPPLV
jgi:N-acetyl-gamma-glutamyl-phosphate reductase